MNALLDASLNNPQHRRQKSSACRNPSPSPQPGGGPVPAANSSGTFFPEPSPAASTPSTSPGTPGAKERKEVATVERQVEALEKEFFPLSVRAGMGIQDKFSLEALRRR